MIIVSGHQLYSDCACQFRVKGLYKYRKCSRSKIGVAPLPENWEESEKRRVGATVTDYKGQDVLWFIRVSTRIK